MRRELAAQVLHIELGASADQRGDGLDHHTIVGELIGRRLTREELRSFAGAEHDGAITHLSLTPHASAWPRRCTAANRYSSSFGRCSSKTGMSGFRRSAPRRRAA